MAEEVPKIPPVPIIKQPEYPEGRTFPDEVLRAWVTIPSDEPVFIGPLTRGDLDHFLFAFSDVTTAIAELRQGLIEYSSGHLEVANAHLQNAINRNIDAETKNRLLFEAIMKSVIKARQNAGK